jgi:hypothetical protein
MFVFPVVASWPAFGGPKILVYIYIYILALSCAYPCTDLQWIKVALRQRLQIACWSYIQVFIVKYHIVYLAAGMACGRCVVRRRAAVSACKGLWRDCWRDTALLSWTGAGWAVRRPVAGWQAHLGASVWAFKGFWQGGRRAAVRKYGLDSPKVT